MFDCAHNMMMKPRRAPVTCGGAGGRLSSRESLSGVVIVLWSLGFIEPMEKSLLDGGRWISYVESGIECLYELWGENTGRGCVVCRPILECHGEVDDGCGGGGGGGGGGGEDVV